MTKTTPLQLLRVARIGLPALALALGTGAIQAQPRGGPIEGNVAGTQSLSHTNEFVVSSHLCRDLGFVQGSARLSASTPEAITGIQREWAKAPRDKNDLVLVVQADAGLKGPDAKHQAEARAEALRAALVKGGIPQSDVFVHPAKPRSDGMALSCPPIGSPR